MKKNYKKDGSIKQMNDETFLVRLKYVDARGKTVDCKRKAKTKAEAERILKQLRREAAEAQQEEKLLRLDVHRFSVEQYMKRLFLPYKSNLKAASYRRLESTVETHILSKHGMKIWTQLTDDDISLLLKGMKAEGLSHSSIKKVYDAYNNMFRFAVNIRRDISSEDNPMNAVHMISEHEFETKEVRWFSPQEISLFASEAGRTFKNGTDVYRYGLVYLFLLNTGLREGEVCALDKNDIDFENKLIRVTKGINTKTVKRPDGSNAYSLEVTTPKTKNSVRYVPLNGEAEKYAEMILQRFPKGERFIYNATNKIVRPDTLYKQFNSILNHAGLVGQCGLHTLRHTFVSALFEHGVDIYTIAEIIGDTVDTVVKTYLHLYKSRKAKAVKFINVIESSKNSIA